MRALLEADGGPVLAVHGGAGRWPQDPSLRARVQRGLREAVEAGLAELAAGRSALAAVVAAVEVLEDCEVTNAGRGSVRSREGHFELDAAVMEGAGRRAGAVAGVRRLRHPVRAALEVLRDGRHVLLWGEGAEGLALERGCEAVAPEHFAVESAGPRPQSSGTVGAVARDARGDLAAATSTGGTPGKRGGRLSDSCLVGAGTWAENATCAVSATGDGEYFIRSAFAHAVACALRPGTATLEEACARALASVSELGGHGGCVAVDRSGCVALPFDTAGMPRAVGRSGRIELAIDPRPSTATGPA